MWSSKQGYLKFQKLCMQQEKEINAIAIDSARA